MRTQRTRTLYKVWWLISFFKKQLTAKLAMQKISKKKIFWNLKMTYYVIVTFSDLAVQNPFINECVKIPEFLKDRVFLWVIEELSFIITKLTQNERNQFSSFFLSPNTRRTSKGKTLNKKSIILLVLLLTYNIVHKSALINA